MALLAPCVGLDGGQGDGEDDVVHQGATRGH